MLRCLALDPARTVGWAFAEGAGEPEHGIYRLPSTFNGYGAYCSRYRFWLQGIITALHPKLIAYEAPILKPTDRLEFVRGTYALGTMTEEIAYDLKIECVEATAGDVRKHFLGIGVKRARKKRGENIKEIVIAECRRRGWTPFDHNAADALAILDYIRANRMPGWASKGLPLLSKADAA